MAAPWRPDRLAQGIAEQVVRMVVDAIDVNALVQRIDLNAVLDQVDLDKLAERIDVQHLVEQIDVDELLAHIDVNALIDRLDIQAVVDRIDVDSLVSNTELGSIIARSTSSVLSEVLDLVRSQGVGLDGFVNRWVNRALRRTGELPLGPPLLVRSPSALPAGTLSSDPKQACA
jgi:hypothetical protein